MTSLGKARSVRWALMALLTTGALTSPRPATAQEDGDEAKTPKERARELFAIGFENYERGDYETAIKAYEQAFALVQYPVITFNIGLAYEKLRRPVEAVQAMEKVLAAPGSLPPSRLDQARATLAEQKALVAELDISCNVTGARLKLGDDEIGTIPLPKPIPVAAGKVVVLQATKSGYQAGHAKVAPPGGQKVPVTIELEEASKVPAQITVETTLPESEVYVDGKLVAITPLRSSIPVTPDVSHRIELRRKGYTTASETITLTENATASLALQPQENREAALATGGELVLTLAQPDASVIVDGTRREVTDGATLRLPEGLHIVSGERKGYDPLRLRVEIPSGGRVERTIDLVPTPATRAELVGDAEYWGTLGWGLTIGGAVFAGVGTGLVVWGVKQIDEGQDIKAAIEANEPPFEACNEAGMDEELNACAQADREAGKKSDRGRLTAGLAGVGAALGTAALVTGIVFLVTGEDPDQYRLKIDEDLFALRPTFYGGPGQGVIGLSGAF